MTLHTVVDVEKVVGITRDDVANWTRRGLLSIPFARPGHGKGRRYSRTNIYEMALLVALSGAGIRQDEASRHLRERLIFIAKKQAEELSEVFSDLDQFNEERWLGLELSHRDLHAPVYWVITPHRFMSNKYRVSACGLKALSDVIAFHNSDNTVVINVTRVLARIDAALDGEPDPTAPKAATRNEPDHAFKK